LSKYINNNIHANDATLKYLNEITINLNKNKEDNEIIFSAINEIKNTQNIILKKLILYENKQNKSKTNFE